MTRKPHPYTPARIREIRQALGESQAKFAKRCRVTVLTVCRWEMPEDKPEAHTPNQERILRALKRAEREAGKAVTP
jgi:DNA-binding transcriptional regulator YiaG